MLSEPAFRLLGSTDASRLPSCWFVLLALHVALPDGVEYLVGQSDGHMRRRRRRASVFDRLVRESFFADPNVCCGVLEG